MSIKLNAASGGSVALDAPTQTTSSADLTFKLPVADGSANQVVKTDGSGNLSFGGAGKILQVVQSVVSDGEHIFNSNSYAASNLSCTITPTRASSKILIQSTQVLDTKSSGRQLYLAIFRSIAGGSFSNISGGSEAGNVAAYSSNARLIETALIIKLDTPTYSVGQSITYKIYGKSNGSHDTATGGQDTEQLLVLQEVAA